MKLRVKQAALTCALAVPLVVTFVFAGPVTASTDAQAGMRMVGPQNPILADTNGDGLPGPGDTSVTPTLGSGGSSIELPLLFSCNRAANNSASLLDTDASGKYRRVRRRNNFRDQSFYIDGVQGDGANAFSYAESDNSQVHARGTGNMMDSNRDGNSDMVQIAGNISLMATLVFTPNSGHASIPTSQAAMLGAKGGVCGPSFIPQIWVPLADTDGDGRGDTIILDLDGNGIPDPQFYRSIRLGAVGVPTTNTIGLSILMVVLGSIGAWYLGQRRLGDAGTA
jgi:hypothetical protein